MESSSLCFKGSYLTKFVHEASGKEALPNECLILFCTARAPAAAGQTDCAAADAGAPCVPGDATELLQVCCHISWTSTYGGVQLYIAIPVKREQPAGFSYAVLVGPLPRCGPRLRAEGIPNQHRSSALIFSDLLIGFLTRSCQSSPIQLSFCI